MSAAHRTRLMVLTTLILGAPPGCSPQLAQRVVVEGTFWALGESIKAQQRQREQQAQLAREQALRQEFHQKLALISRQSGQNNVEFRPDGTIVYRAVPGSPPTLAAPAGAVRVASAPPRVGSGAGVRLAKNVNINLVSPAVGTAPHYIAFNVDLPPDVIQEADFLWMDNGMWICDEPKGVKILETPGRHRISVLVVTKDGQEYRGTTDVVVLAKASDASRSDARVGMN